MTLITRLLNESSVPMNETIDLITMLRLQASPPPLQPTHDVCALLPALVEKDAQIAVGDEYIRILEARVTSLDETCRAQLQGTKRGHDDQDDPDGHEGLKRRRIETSTEVMAATEQNQALLSLRPGPLLIVWNLRLTLLTIRAY